MSCCRLSLSLALPTILLAAAMAASPALAALEDDAGQASPAILLGTWTCKGTQKDGRNSARMNFDVEYRADGSSSGLIDLTLRFPGGRIQAAYEYSSRWTLKGDKFWDRPLEVMSVSYTTSGNKSGSGPSEIDLLDVLSEGNDAPYRLDVISDKKVDFHVPGRARPIRCRRNKVD